MACCTVCAMPLDITHASAELLASCRTGMWTGCAMHQGVRIITQSEGELNSVTLVDDEH